MFRCRENVDEIVSDSIEELSSDEESTLLCYEEMFESPSSENETNWKNPLVRNTVMHFAVVI